MNYEVDARGLACPLPVVNTKKKLEEMKNGEEVKVIVDNEIAVQNLTKFANQKNMKVSSEKKEDNLYNVTIVKSGEAAKASENTEEETEEELCNLDQRNKGLLVVISSKTMGNGDDTLGTALMKAFVFALTKQDILPERVIMYNGGAFLSCEGSDSLEDLKYLEACGVEILTCGTCLNHYGLSEKLAVGAVTNMYDIVEKMEQAKKIVRP